MQVVLIRHAHSEANAKAILSGRLPNNNLSEKGKLQSEELSGRLGSFKINQIRVSPMPRCSQTITPWLQTLPHKFQEKLCVDENLNEVDYGSWSGKKLAILSRNKLWATVQNNPSAMYFPGGEGIAQMQTRAMSSIHEAVRSKNKGAIVIVSHGDVLKAILASALGMHLDNFQRLVIDPASVSILDFANSVPKLLLINDTHSKLHGTLKSKSTIGNTLGGGSGR